MNLSEIRQRVQDRIADSSASTQSIVDEKISETLEEIYTRVPSARWYYKESGLVTTPQLSGTVAAGTTVQVDRGRSLVFFSSSVELGKQYIGGDLKVGADEDSYRILDVGLPGVVPTMDLDGMSEGIGDIHRYAIIDRPYQSPADSAAAFTITQDQYFLRSDVAFVEWIVNHEFPQTMVAIDPSIARFYVPDPHNLGAAGNPWAFEHLGRQTITYLSSYSGNDRTTKIAKAAVTQGSHAVTISNLESQHDSENGMYGWTNRDEALVGTAFRAEGTEPHYIISSVEAGASDDGLLVLLEERYRGDTGSVDFAIGPTDAPLIRLYSVPTAAQRVSYGYYRQERFPLIDDEDRPLLPVEHHGVIVDGAIWRMLQFVDSQAQHAAFNRFVRGLDRISQMSGKRRERTRRLRMDRTRTGERFVNLGGNYPPLRVP